jgi:hypothetical protein
MSINRSIDLPFASVRLLKTTSSTILIAVLPQAIWSVESGRMTMLVPVLLAATVVAMTGFGRIPLQNRNGITPWSGATVGQVAKESAAARAAINALKARNTVADATLEVLVIFLPPMPSLRANSIRAWTQASIYLIIDYRHNDVSSI